MGRVGLQAFILDIIAASPPPLAPLDRGRDGEVLCASPPPLASKAVLRRDGSKREAGSGETVTVTVDGGGGVEAPDFEVELADVLDRMAGVVLTEVRVWRRFVVGFVFCSLFFFFLRCCGWSVLRFL